MPFVRFMEIALYDPVVGYYRANRPRIGYGGGTDFYTASTSGAIYGEMIAAACVTLLGGRDPKAFTFVEIGAEPAGGIFSGVEHPFGRTRIVRVGETIEPTGQCIVFSNELFDAQPFRRFVFRGGKWHELGVALRDECLHEVELPAPEVPAEFPASAGEGYVIDAPTAATQLVEQIAAGEWAGLFIASDYGKSWRELIEATPAGTARAYHRHTQSNDLLNHPGEQDLTCHVCWDWLAAVLSRHGFRTPTLESQEAFFVHHASRLMASISAAEAARLSQRKLSLMQLLHPSHLGQKFQVLHATRFEKGRAAE